MELINELPNDIHFNVIKFMKHPLAEMLENAWDDLVSVGEGNYWSDFVFIQLSNSYRMKCRNNPKNCHLIKQELDCYKRTIDIDPFSD